MEHPDILISDEPPKKRPKTDDSNDASASSSKLHIPDKEDDSESNGIDSQHPSNISIPNNSEPNSSIEAATCDEENEDETEQNNGDENNKVSDSSSSDEEVVSGKGEDPDIEILSATKTPKPPKKTKKKSVKKKAKSSNMRKNIKDILKSDQLDKHTIEARKEEAARRERMQLKQQILLQQQQRNYLRQQLQIQELYKQQMALMSETSGEKDLYLRQIYEDRKKLIAQKVKEFEMQSSKAPIVPEVVTVSSDEDDEVSVINNGSSSMHKEVQDSHFETDVPRLPEKYKTESAAREELPKSEVAGDDDDDDCILISPTPDDDIKDETKLDQLNIPDEFGRVLVNVGHPDTEPDIFLPPQITKVIKPHQIGGIRFLYDNVVESIEQFDKTLGFGCILAQSMGLGKTLQATTFCDIFLRAVPRANTILVIVPINTIQNWVNEFNHWVPPKDPNQRTKTHSSKKLRRNNVKPSASQNGFNNHTTTTDLPSNSESNGHELIDTSCEDATETAEIRNDLDDIQYRCFDLFVLNETVKTLQAREKIIKDWANSRGVLLMGYEMYRMLALRKLKRSRKSLESFGYNSLGFDNKFAEDEASLDRIYSCLVNPGPDLVICDEGHRIKNSGASISQALKAIRTRRRIVLTGYPLQNNLMEYWCMVDFIRPNYLGSKAEFSNMFERPIQNGQCIDSTYEDKRLMRFRSHVLHSLLEGFVQRRSHMVLKAALPKKEEWVFLVKMSPIQCTLYKEFIKYLTICAETQASSANPIKAFAVCCKIWNHPDALYNVLKKKRSILDDLDIDGIADDQNNKKKTGRRKKDNTGNNMSNSSNSNNNNNPLDFSSYLGHSTETPSSSKFNTSASGYQSLSLDWAIPIFETYTPGVLEYGVKMELLFEILNESVAMGDKMLVFSQSLLTLDLIESFLAQKLQWNKNTQYYRLDGSTTGLDREKLIAEFNSEKSIHLFLVSTRAGSLGINLTSANRVVVFDASWNPCHDCQAVCRIYRYGQTKPCQIYRFVTDFTLEKRIYDRQINKRGMADRVVDEMNPTTYLKSKDVNAYLVLDMNHLEKLPYIKCDVDPEKFSDPIMQKVLQGAKDKLTQEPFEHESLLIDQKHQKLSAAEKRMAHQHYEREKKNISIHGSTFTYTRPSYAAFYPKTESSTSHSNSNPPPVPSSSSSMASLYSNKRFNLYNQPHHHQPTNRPFQSDFNSTYQTSRPSFGNGPSDFPVEALRQRGISVQSYVLKKDSFLPDPSGGPDMYLMAGEKLYVIRSSKGTYLRLSNGRFIAVRKSSSSIGLASLQIPHTEELSKEQLSAIVYSLLKLPGRRQYSEDSGDSLYGEYEKRNHFRLPLEQPLPPSSVIPPNRYEIPSARLLDSGGNVIVSSDNGRTTSYATSTYNSCSSSSNGGNEFPDLSAINPSFSSFRDKLNYFNSVSSSSSNTTQSSHHQVNSEALNRLSRLTDSLPSFQQFDSPSSLDRYNDRMFKSDHHQQQSSSAALNLAYDKSVISGSELELIPIAQNISTNMASETVNSTPGTGSLESFLNSKFHKSYEDWSSSLRNNNSSSHNGADFYKDFTITVNQSNENRLSLNRMLSSRNGDSGNNYGSGNQSVSAPYFYDEVSGSSSSDSASVQLIRSAAEGNSSVIINTSSNNNGTGDQCLNLKASF